MHVIHVEGLIVLRMILLGTSRRAYGKKKTVLAILYCWSLMPRVSLIPATLALAMLDLSRKDKT